MNWNTVPNQPEVMTEQQAAAFIRKSAATMRRWRRLSIGPAWCRPNGQKTPVYLRTDLQRWIEAGRIEPRSAA